MTVVPEFIIHQALQSALNFVRQDYIDHVDKTETWLYRLFAGTKFQRYDYFKQAESVICGPIDSPRFLEIDLGFNDKRDRLPTISILNPGEETQQGGNGIGQDEGYEDYIIDEGDPENEIAGSYTPVFARRFESVYDIVIMSDNSNEAILLYHFIKALLIATTFHMNQMGLQNVSLGGRDLTPNDQTSANQLYQKVVRMRCQYDQSVPAIHALPMPHQIDVPDGKPVLE